MEEKGSIGGQFRESTGCSAFHKLRCRGTWAAPKPDCFREGVGRIMCSQRTEGGGGL